MDRKRASDWTACFQFCWIDKVAELNPCEGNSVWSFNFHIWHSLTQVWPENWNLNSLYVSDQKMCFRCESMRKNTAVILIELGLMCSSVALLHLKQTEWWSQFLLSEIFQTPNTEWLVFCPAFSWKASVALSSTFLCSTSVLPARLLSFSLPFSASLLSASAHLSLTLLPHPLLLLLLLLVSFFFLLVSLFLLHLSLGQQELASSTSWPVKNSSRFWGGGGARLY